MTRAKFKCVDVKEGPDGSQVKLEPVVSGSQENESFFKWTPWGSIEIGTVNPNVKFEVGQEYYVDFTKASE
jgi:hypothetical protein